MNLGLVEICFKLKGIFGSNLDILVNFGVKFEGKIEEKCEINLGNILGCKWQLNG